MLSELGKYLGGSKMRVIFMGTPDFSVGTLEAIIEAGHEVALVVTQPDKPKGTIFGGDSKDSNTY